MHLSRYLKIFAYPEQEGHFLLYSTRHTSCILVSGEMLNAIRSGDLSPDDSETLEEIGILVSDLDAEKEEMRGIFDETNRLRRLFSAIVVLNLDCNLACTYCFEGGARGRHYMSAETADLLVEIIEKEHIAKGKAVSLDFFGGEPLLSLDLIRSISRRLKASAEAHGVMYSFALITNGTLYRREIAEELRSLGLSKIKITIDGPKENHDRFRPFISGKGSYDVIVANLKETWDVVPVQIGGNFSRDNYREFPLLLDSLLAEGITPDKTDIVKFDPITATVCDYGLPEFKDGCSSLSEPWLIEATLYLRQETLKRGYESPRMQPTPCMIELNDDLVVNWEGTLYKCPGLIGLKEMAVGDLWTGIKDFRESHGLDVWKNEECLECEYLPLCFGGCRLLKILTSGAVTGVECKRYFLDETLETILTQDMESRQSDPE